MLFKLNKNELEQRAQDWFWTQDSQSTLYCWQLRSTATSTIARWNKGVRIIHVSIYRYISSNEGGTCEYVYQCCCCHCLYNYNTTITTMTAEQRKMIKGQDWKKRGREEGKIRRGHIVLAFVNLLCAGMNMFTCVCTSVQHVFTCAFTRGQNTKHVLEK